VGEEEEEEEEEGRWRGLDAPATKSTTPRKDTPCKVWGGLYFSYSIYAVPRKTGEGFEPPMP
jgi:hypothetical protein